MFDQFQATSERFLMRQLRESDATQRYLDWLSDADAQKYIQAAQSTKKIMEISNYIKSRRNRDDTLFLGIFEKNTNQHIGNIKFEPIDHEKNMAVVGVLIGEISWRGKNVFSEIFNVLSVKLGTQYHIQRFELGVDAMHYSAIKSYEKAGFRIVEDGVFVKNTADTIVMRYGDH